MPLQLKYVRFSDDGFAIFTPHAKHSDIAKTFEPSKPVSAGFINLSDEEITAEGRSDSLDLEPLDDDADFLADVLGL